jgi:hypothetical protein
MLYVIFSEDVMESGALRAAARPRHLARLETLRTEGRLILAGPCPAIDSPDPGPAGFTGSVIIAEFTSLSEAQHWANSDPYVEGGVYAHTVVKPFKSVFP